MPRLPLLSCVAFLALQSPAVVVAANVAVARPALSGLPARLDAQLALIAEWAADPAIIAAVRAHNTALSPEEDALTQESWHSLSSLDPLLRRYTKSAIGAFLSGKQSALVGEAFVSDAAGYKVGFINKPTHWCHAGMPKHEVPMTGKSWQGGVVLDESTGLRLIQIAVPILDGGKPIGSFVVGLSRAVLSE